MEQLPSVPNSSKVLVLLPCKEKSCKHDRRLGWQEVKILSNNMSRALVTSMIEGWVKNIRNWTNQFNSKGVSCVNDASNLSFMHIYIVEILLDDPNSILNRYSFLKILNREYSLPQAARWAGFGRDPARCRAARWVTSTWMYGVRRESCSILILGVKSGNYHILPKNWTQLWHACCNSTPLVVTEIRWKSTFFCLPLMDEATNQD